MYNYVVTAHKPTRVSKTAVGNFLGPDQRNLIVAKVNYIDIFTLSAEGLACTVELPIYGTISVMTLIRMPQDTQHSLVILTEKHKLCILRWSTSDNRCHTVSVGDMQDHFSTQMSSEKIGIVDPNARCIALHQYPRLLKVVPTATDADKTAFNVRLPDDQVTDMVFLHGRVNPTIAVLSETGKHSYYEMRTYEISMSDQDISAGEWSKTNLDTSRAKMIAVPEPICGVLIFGDDTIYYLGPGGNELKQPIDVTIITAVCQVDNEGRRYLMGDHKGQLMMLMIAVGQDGLAEELRVETLGETSVASSISYLDSGFVYVGSSTGDSQLVKLNTVPNRETGAYLDIVQNYTHLGPILDFCIVKGMGYLRQGQGQVVTCSGMGKDGSLRVIRNGIGISEEAYVELPGIKDMYSLRRHVGDRYHSYLVQSFTSETRVLELIGADEMAPATLPGFDEAAPTLHAANMIGDIMVQVTTQGVRVTDCATMTAQPNLVWTPPSGVRVSIASGNTTQLLLATTGGTLIYLAVDEEKKTLVEVAHTKMDNEISCVNCNVLQLSSAMRDTEDAPSKDGKAFVAVVGLWAEVGVSPVVKLVALPSLVTIHTVELGGDVIARCVMLCTMEGHHYLLVALGDGCLLTYSVNAEAAATAAASDDPDIQNAMNMAEITSERRKLSIGTQPADLSIFKSKGADHVFAACDRPTVVYASTGGAKLLVSNVNLQEVSRVCGFDTEAFPDCLAIATEGALHLGAVDEIQKLHISTIPLGEQPRRIAHVDTARIFAILTETNHIDKSGDETVDHFLRTIDDTRYDTIAKHKLKHLESGASLTVASFTGEEMNSDEQFVVVGTGFEHPTERDPKDGRILIFRVDDSRPHLVAEQEVNGAVYSLCGYNGMLLASIGPEVRLFSISARKDGVINFKLEYRHLGHILAYRIACRGDFILVGDIFRSITVLACRKVGDNYRLEQVSKDYDVTWVMAVEMLDDDLYLMGEHSNHLYTHQRDSSASGEAERGRLERVGQYHVGSRVNRIQHGSLVMQLAENDGPALKTLIFGTTDGMLGVIANIKQDAFTFFLELQNAMATLIPGIGGLGHAEWREMVIDHPPRTAPAKNFLDGDLIERFLNLNMAQMSKVSAMVNVGVDELVQRVEEMQRLHGAG